MGAGNPGTFFSGNLSLCKNPWVFVEILEFCWKFLSFWVNIFNFSMKMARNHLNTLKSAILCSFQFSKVKSGQKTGFFRKIELMKNFLEFLEDFALSFEIPWVFLAWVFSQNVKRQTRDVTVTTQKYPNLPSVSYKVMPHANFQPSTWFLAAPRPFFTFRLLL